MAEITAAMVKELREQTGAGMMDCKKALNETNGNMEEAVEVLRKNGQAKAVKKEGRIAAEGLCRIARNGDTVAAVVEVNSETDFVAKNETFQQFVEAAEGCVATYIHGGGRIGVIVEGKTAVVNEAVKEALVNIAMQIAALSPKYVATSDVSEEYKAHEKEIIAAQIAQDPKMAGKSEKVIEGAVMGRLNKELKEVCLLEQVYVKAEDGKQTVAQYLAQVSKENGTELCVKKFVRFETGEGIEKKQEDFAAEVAAQMNA